MSETSRTELRALLVAGYADLAHRLARLLGSTDMAEEALQDTYLRLARPGDVGSIHSPRAYLLRMAVNLSRSRQRTERRRLTVAEGDAILERFDEAPGPEQIVEARSDLAALRIALSHMPSRRREIFLAAWAEELPHAQIADRFGVTLRTVQLELKAAAEHCADHLGKKIEKKFVKPVPLTSSR